MQSSILRRFSLVIMVSFIFLYPNFMAAAKMITGDVPCSHSPNLVVVHHTGLAHAEYLLAKTCQIMGVRVANYSIQLVRYKDGYPYRNAQVCRGNGSIYLGLAVYEEFRDRPHVLVWLLAHEIGHTTIEWNGFEPKMRARSQEEVAFLRGFNYDQRVELASDREALKRIFLVYSSEEVKEAIQELAKVMDSPAETLTESTHPGYMDRIQNMSYYRLHFKFSGRPVSKRKSAARPQATGVKSATLDGRAKLLRRNARPNSSSNDGR